MKLVDKKLSTLHWEVYNYLKENHMGKDNKIGMFELSENLIISDRRLRLIIKDIIESQEVKTVIGSDQNGYYVASNEQELGEAIAMIKSRLKGTLKRYFASTPNDRKWLYNYLRELEQEYDTAPQGQTVAQFNGTEKDINYFGKRN
jgi:hypothetical protein